MPSDECLSAPELITKSLSSLELSLLRILLLMRVITISLLVGTLHIQNFPDQEQMFLLLTNKEKRKKKSHHQAGSLT